MNLYLVTEVGSSGHVAKEPDFDDTGKHLDSCHDLSYTLVHTLPHSRKGKEHTLKGSFIISRGNGASMTKLPLSVTTGPAFLTAMRSEA
jgi:hypothetical protein